MEPMLPLKPQLIRQVQLLSNSLTRLSLMSVVIPNLSRQATVAAVLAAVTSTDLVGMLEDGSIGVFSLRAPHADNGGGVDERFLPRLQTALGNAFSPGFGSNVKIWFRSVHRWASELSDGEELVDALFAASSRVVGIGMQPVPPATLLPFRRPRPVGSAVWPQ
jgi:hypothetical protein